MQGREAGNTSVRAAALAQSHWRSALHDRRVYRRLLDISCKQGSVQCELVC
jgi:hypothetical protein